MLEILCDLCRHAAWADARHIRAIQACRDAEQDSEMLARLRHMHLAQRHYLAFIEGTATEVEDPWGILSSCFERLSNSIRAYYCEVTAFLSSSSEGRLEKIARYPGEALAAAASDILLQSVMHSHYHRAQNARRLRELGGEPPMTDYICWVFEGKPDADWER